MSAGRLGMGRYRTITRQGFLLMANFEVKTRRQRTRTLVFETCEPRRRFANLPFGAMPQDTRSYARTDRSDSRLS